MFSSYHSAVFSFLPNKILQLCLNITKLLMLMGALATNLRNLYASILCRLQNNYRLLEISVIQTYEVLEVSQQYAMQCLLVYWNTLCELIIKAFIINQHLIAQDGSFNSPTIHITPWFVNYYNINILGCKSWMLSFYILIQNVSNNNNDNI
jgi:hypothetical protein